MPSILRPVILSSAIFAASVLAAIPPAASEVVSRARACIGSESALDALVTLKITGRILPATPEMPEARIMLTARRPLSQRLEVQIGDIIETTLLNGKRGCLMRSSASMRGSHQMRALSPQESERLQLSTVNLFSFYRPDVRSGENLTYEGIVLYRGVRCHHLVYTCPDGSTTTRYFAISDNRCVSSRDCFGVETVESGGQFVGGIRFPEKIESFQGGQLLHTLVLEKILVNKPLRVGVFSVPSRTSPGEVIVSGDEWSARLQ